ncbi:hypothetical protein KIN20_023485 [Parelaphostrongylus tenuis]|uniref:Uncharacterized protein n=1 Tax=Parelaphostrongylus tenuis TaxID=148309 RepID=A0AAD5MS33_PARTN|nr:hypothetical protein KIN20_023485 [Parelaphostrongylus tenuis]
MAVVGPPGQSSGSSQPTGTPFYGQPAPMYPNAGYPGSYPYHAPHASMPPGHAVTPSQQPPPPPAPQFAPGTHPAAHPAHPQHQQYMHQQQMWRSAYPAPGPGQMPPQAPRYAYPSRIPAPQAAPNQQSAPSPGANKMRYPPQPPPSQPVVAPQQQQQQYPTSAIAVGRLISIVCYPHGSLRLLQ